LGWEGWFTLAVVAAVFVGLIRGVGSPDMLLLGGMVLVALAGIVTPEELLVGFSNPGMLTVAALFVVAAALRETAALDRLAGRMFGAARPEPGLLARMVPQAAALSAFLNNTAVVAMLLSPVSDWCRKNRISPSRLLLPLSYLAILGGMCTLIGTSTNLVVHGLMLETARTHEDPQVQQSLAGGISFFELAKLGVPCLLVGAAYLWVVGRWLLPDRRDLLEQLGESSREYLANMLVEPGCRLVGQRVEDAGLRHLPGLFLIEIVRAGRIIAPVEPDEVLDAGDRLTFTGVVSTIVDLERIPGLVPIGDESGQSDDTPRTERRYCEAVTSATSPLIGKTIRDGNFRAMYNAAVVAVHRGGARLRGRVGDIVLRPGDTLLLQAGVHFANAHRNNPDFYLVSGVEEARPVRHQLAFTSLVALGLLIALAAFNLVPIVVAAFLVAGLMIATRCISTAEARRSVRWDVLLTIAAAFGLGKALVNSGAAAEIGDLVVGFTQPWGRLAALAALYAVTVLLTSLLTNNASAVLMFPLALAVAAELGLDPRPFVMAVVFAASASFATPIAYQTNLLVFGPGGYRFADFVRLGVPLNLLLGILAVLAIPWLWPFPQAAGG
jgi:di/tricarboxylate transporter